MTTEPLDPLRAIRDSFEKFAISKAWDIERYSPGYFTHDNEGEYILIQEAWEAWQAALSEQLPSDAGERSLSTSDKADIADCIATESRSVTDVVQDVYDELAERGYIVKEPLSEGVPDGEIIEVMADSMLEHIPSRGWFDPSDPGAAKWAEAIATSCSEASLSALRSHYHITIKRKESV